MDVWTGDESHHLAKVVADHQPELWQHLVCHVWTWAATWWLWSWPVFRTDPGESLISLLFSDPKNEWQGAFGEKPHPVPKLQGFTWPISQYLAAKADPLRDFHYGGLGRCHVLCGRFHGTLRALGRTPWPGTPVASPFRKGSTFRFFLCVLSV